MGLVVAVASHGDVQAADVSADEARADEARADEARADEARADEARADEARADEARAVSELAEDRRVRSVTLVGAHAIDADELLAGLAHHPPSGVLFKDLARYDPIALEVDRRRIRSFCRARGFLDARVTKVEVEVEDRDENEVAIRFFLVEGPPTILERVDLVGVSDCPGCAPALPLSQLTPSTSTTAIVAHAIDVAALELNRPLVYGRYVDLRAQVQAFYVAQGFAHATVEGRVLVDREAHSAVVRLVLDSGPSVRFGAIRVEGLSEIPESSVRHRIFWEPGDGFDPDKLLRTRRALYASGLVEGVRFEWSKVDRPEVIDVVLHVAEPTPNELRLGGGIGIEPVHYELRARASYARKRFIDPLTTLFVDARPAWALFRNGEYAGFNVQASTSLERQDFLVPRLKATGTLAYRQVRYEGYSTLGPSVGVGLNRAFLDDRLRIDVKGALEVSAISADFDLSAVRAFGVSAALPVFLLETTLAFEGRDDPIEPHKGVFLSGSVELGAATEGEKARYVLLTPDARGYLPLGSRVVLAGRVKLGARLLATGAVPVTRRYFGGGAEEQRGFARRRLSPGIWHDPDGRVVSEADAEAAAQVGTGASSTGASGTAANLAFVPLGGEASIATSLEARVNVLRIFQQWLAVVAFLDGGDTTLTFSDIDVSRLHWATGGGLRYHTPVGPIRVDVGFRLNRMMPAPDPNPAWALHISLGEAF
ncbi:MAG: BamA/TamA family outer membrane protein [Deltaproteobacteria bacterium]|nr:BamA/TamA family outer membrane protein [Deltaproteobacteria bacterium]